VRGQFGPELLAGELWVRIAQTRETGTATLKTQVVRGRMMFVRGRPEGVRLADGAIHWKREPVVLLLRKTATLDRGSFVFEATTEGQQTSLKIDPLGEVVTAVLQSTADATLQAVHERRAPVIVQADALFAPLAQAMRSISHVALTPPAAPIAFGELVRGRTASEQRGLLALLVAGGLVAVNDADRVLWRTERDPEVHDMGQRLERALDGIEAKDAYTLLGVAATAKAEDIRKVYFDLAKTFHTDRLAAARYPPRINQLASTFFSHCEVAYRTLMSPEERKKVDVILDRKSKGLPTDAAVVVRAERLFQQGRNLAKSKRVKDAEPLLREAVGLNPGEGEFWAWLAYCVYRLQGRPGYREAERYMTDAISRSPQSDVPHELWGEILLLQGDPALAKKAFQRALELNAHNQNAKRQLHYMERRSGPKGPSQN
jgi:hypothetical protein